MIPLRISETLERVPWMNWFLIAGTSAISIWLFNHPDNQHLAKYFVYSDRYPLSVLGSIFAHADYLHLFGNMLFLWVFGNGVCSMVGNFTYVGLYLALGVLAAWTHNFIDGHPLIGASGAIFGIVGLAVAIFPFARVSLLHFFAMVPRLWKVPLWGIALYWASMDLSRAYLGGGAVAYWAHLGGVGCGVAIGLALLATRYVRLTQYDDASLLDILLRRDRVQLEHQRAGGPVRARRAGEPLPAWQEPTPPAERPRLKLRVGAGAAARDAASSETTPATTSTAFASDSANTTETPAHAPAAEAAPLPKLSLPRRTLIDAAAIAAPAPAQPEAKVTPERETAPTTAAPALNAADCFLFDGANRVGPITALEMQQRIVAAADTTGWMFWQQGMSGWQTVAASQVSMDSRSVGTPNGVSALGAM